MKVGNYYKAPMPKNQYHKIVGEEGNKFLVLDLNFPAQGTIKVTKSVLEYTCEEVSEKEVLDWFVKQIMEENQISLQDKIDEAKQILKDIDKELKIYNKLGDMDETM